jgi:hypothetical protein
MSGRERDVPRTERAGLDRLDSQRVGGGQS